jgi:hypothetical protein
MPSGKKHTLLGRTVERKPIFYTPIAVGSLLFNDPNQFLQFPREGVINLTDGASPFTIEAWIKPTSIRTLPTDINGNPNPLDYGNIIIGDSEGGGNNWSLQLFNNKLTFYRYNSTLGGPRFFTSTNQIPLNSWTHVAVSYDGFATLCIFINGVLDTIFADYSPPDTQYSVITIGNLFLAGSLPASAGAYAYEGYITNLRINDDQFFYQYVSPFEPTAPLGYISGTTLLLLANISEPTKDSSSGDVTITNVGSVTSSSQYPTVADCSNNNAKALMVGWYAGPRPLTRDNENLYTYYADGNPGDETLDRGDSSSPWVYRNLGNEIVTSLTVAEFPWQASWPSPYTATKICPGGPIGIPVGAIGQQVIVSNLDDYSSSTVNGTYNKDYQGPGIPIADGYPQTTVTIKYSGPLNAASYSYFICFVLERNRWEIGLSYSDENASWWDIIASNPSSNENLIPTMFWSPSLTISAA